MKSVLQDIDQPNDEPCEGIGDLWELITEAEDLLSDLEGEMLFHKEKRERQERYEREEKDRQDRLAREEREEREEDRRMKFEIEMKRIERCPMSEHATVGRTATQPKLPQLSFPRFNDDILK